MDNPSNENGVEDFTENLNPDSLVILKNCKVEPQVAAAKPGDTFQFMRQGYFCIDKDSNGENLIINRTVALKDSFSPKK